MTRLSNIRDLGLYTDPATGKSFNVKKGRNMQRGTDVLFYLYRSSRVFITDAYFYNELKKVQV